MAELGPGLRREDKEGGIALNHPNASNGMTAHYHAMIRRHGRADRLPMF
jgi:hypothetical protein